jgi:peptidoglycan/xylan/chitin deacetylase (PgdA/CDA1 family)
MEGRNDENQLLSRGQLVEMAENGMEIAAHTRTHRDLSVLDHSEVTDEVLGSRRDLEEILGMPVTSFAYPFGRWNEMVVDTVRSAGFRLACGVRPGWADTANETFLLRRVTVFAQDTAGEFARKLVFASNDVNWKKMTAYFAARIRDRIGIRN